MPHADARPVPTWIITVSTSRTVAEDRSGPVLRAALEAGGHPVAGTTLVADDPDAIGQALDAALGLAEAVVLTGGTGVSARDCTPSVVRERLDRELPGFGELFRMLSFQDVGSAAMLSTAVGGIARGRAVFALPGSPRACQLAMERLIVPELAHLLHEVGKEAPLPPKVKPVRRHGDDAPTEALTPASPLAPPQEGLVVRPIAEARAESDTPPDVPANTWLAGLEALSGTVERGRPTELPDRFGRMAAVRDVLSTAGDVATVRLPQGDYLAFGFPDLTRASSKVLLVRDVEPYGEIVALHRWPARVGVCPEGDGLVASADLDPAGVVEELTGSTTPVQGMLLAVEKSAVWLVANRRARRFDGRRLGEELPVVTALGSLVLDWSQR